MRELKFIVTGQIIKPDPDCNFSNLVPGTESYLKAKFSFSSEWAGCQKVAGFYSGNHEYPPKVISELNSCLIPVEVLKRPIFTICVIGQRGDFKIKTNRVTVRQNGGNV